MIATPACLVSSVNDRHTSTTNININNTASMLSCFGFGNGDDDQRPLLPQYRDDTVLQVPVQLLRPLPII